MTSPGDHESRDDAPGGGSAAVLRAIGSLLVALSGGDEQAQERARRLASNGDRARTQRGRTAEDQPAAPRGETSVSNPTGGQPRPERARDDAAPARYRPGDDAPPATPDGEDDEVEWLLADARTRAQHILDESMEKAEELLAQRTGGVSERMLTEIRRTVSDLVGGMTEVRQRLARIETLLRERETERRAREEQASQVRPATQRAAPGPRPERASFSVVPPEAPASATPPPHPEPRESSLAPPRAAEARPYDPSPAPARPQPPAEERRDAPDAEPAEQAREPVPPPPDERFHPERGAVLLRVSPVAGFQGLMRVQDALGRVEAIRQATVEAYAQGEARLRLELSEAIRPDEIAASLGRTLEQAADVQSASTTERTVLISLG